jgi:molybdate transport system regulatory protein
MNKLKAIVKQIETLEGITKIVAMCGNISLSAITLELPKNVEVGHEAFFVFKETEVGIAKNLGGEISFSNLFNGIVVSLTKGKILTKTVIDIDGEEIASIITSDAAARLRLELGDTVTAFVKATEVSTEVSH